MKFDFSGKTAVVTGAAKGIGFECARLFAETGANVVVLDMLEAEGQTSADKLSACGVRSRFYCADVTDFTRMREIATEVERDFGSYDISVAAAGILSTGPLLDCTAEEVTRVMRINVNGVIAPTVAAFSVMMRRNAGKIITVSSIAGKAGGGINGNTLYGTSKGAVIAYTKGLAREAAPYNINVNSVCPGPAETSMMDRCSEEQRQAMLAGNMLKRFAQPVDIANSVLFLASEYSRHMTSVIHLVDGGMMKGN